MLTLPKPFTADRNDSRNVEMIKETFESIEETIKKPAEESTQDILED